ncbi:MAG TPA: hypothetical protein VM661_07700 [Candidatus Sulfotelmatobacter sp.]|jgi:hypothetical protein|nr:hypothetical protein [Candidatus Sulfotelmatobacter sp.]
MMTASFSKLRHSDTLWPAVVLATSFMATQIVNIIEFVAVH